MGPKICEVCEESQSKYKCPNCLIPYCSLSCFKKHKETPCVKPEPIAREIVEAPCTKPETSAREIAEAPCMEPEISAREIVDSAPAINDDKPCYVDKPSEVLQESQLQSIALSNEIRDAIKDEKLQKLIHSIDSSANADNVLDKAMEDDEFCLFAEKILSNFGN